MGDPNAWVDSMGLMGNELNFGAGFTVWGVSEQSKAQYTVDNPQPLINKDSASVDKK